MMSAFAASITELGSRFLPYDVKHLLKRMRFHGRSRFCPVCLSHLRLFKPFGLARRPDACCPICGSLERHRLMWVFFRECTDLFDGTPKSVLHVAPEPHLARRLKQAPNLHYLTADLRDPCAMVKMDVTNIQYPDDSFDVILCSHVLEHVVEDRLAIRELKRVLKPDGWALLQVPITCAMTLEDTRIIDPMERRRIFGQSDHVRRYGPDYKERLEESGFKVKRLKAAEIVGHGNIVPMGVAGGELFLCTLRSPD